MGYPDLRCSDPKCTSRTEPDVDTPFFEINLTVDAERLLSESLRKIEAEHFTCNHCNAPAEDTP